jgi:hypothetical protein
MILLISPCSKGKQVLEVLQSTCHGAGLHVPNLGQARRALETRGYSALVIDQAVLDLEPEAASILLQSAGAALPVFVSLAVASPERVAAEVRAALARNEEVAKRARQVAQEEVWCWLKDLVTGLTLECDLALKLSSVSDELEKNLLSLKGLTNEMRLRLAEETEAAGVPR